jgi:hypothetical protein
MKKLLLIAGLCILSLPALPQNASDALRYSRIFYGGTARFQGLAGSMGAVGADFSVIATNPAGLGLFKSFDITFTPSFYIGASKSDYNGNNGYDNRFNFGIGDFGFVGTIETNNKRSGGIRNFNFAIGINRQNDFNRRIYIEGVNKTSSQLTEYINVLNKENIPSGEIYNNYPFDIGLAWNADLIFYDSIPGEYMCYAPNGGVLQQKSITTRGSINEFAFSFGGNLSDKIYFGATIGIPFIRYYESSYYEETRVDPSIQYFRSMTYDYILETHGTGINFKLGLIYRPANWVRIGAAIHTPTFYGNMRDNWSSVMTASFDDPRWNNTQYSPLGSYNYRMTTPFRAIGSLAFIVGAYGLVSAEYEYANYNQARFNDSENSYDDVNQTIRDSYRSPVNIRVGTEWRIMSFRIRGGFGYSNSPYQDNINNGERFLASGGVGYRGKHFFTDVTYVWTQVKEDYYLYDRTLVNPSQNTLSSHSGVFTFGVRF